MRKVSPLRISLIVLGMMMLLAMYLFQRFDFLTFVLATVGYSGDVHPYTYFVVNKTMRLVINDMACFLLMWAVFQEARYLQLGLYVFLLEVLVLLPVYFIIKLSWEGDSEISSPLLSQIHRMIVNPTLMLLLIVALFYQRYKAPEPPKDDRSLTNDQKGT